MKSPKSISSLDNPLFKRVKTLLEGGAKANKLRSELGLAVAEGAHLAQSWLGSEDLVEILTTEAGLALPEIAAVVDMQLALVPNTELFILDETLWKKLSDLGHAPPIVITIKIPEREFPSNLSHDVLILDGVQDAGNVGSMMRTAAGAGLQHIVCMKGTAQAWSPKVLRAAMGAHRHLKIHEGWSLNQVRDKINLPIYSTCLNAEQDLYDLGEALKEPHAWVFGNEGSGINPEFSTFSKGVSIPQDPAIESLNVGAATAICLFEAKRVRRQTS